MFVTIFRFATKSNILQWSQRLETSLIMIAAFVFVGPLPFVPLEPSVALILSMMAVFVIGFAQVKVSSFVRSQKAAIQNGFNADAETYSLITGDL